MKELEGGGRPSRKLTTEDNSYPKGESAANTPLASLIQGHLEELVDALQNFLKEQEHVFGEYLTLEEIVRMQLNFEEDLGNKRKKAFFAPLRRAWDALAYDRYIPGSSEEHQSGVLLSRYYQYYRERTIRLSDPLQVRVIDALAEVVGIPHQKGQAEIAIPEKIKSYDTWTGSPEYQERVARAQAERRKTGLENYARLHSEPSKLQK